MMRAPWTAPKIGTARLAAKVRRAKHGGVYTSTELEASFEASQQCPEEAYAEAEVDMGVNLHMSPTSSSNCYDAAKDHVSTKMHRVHAKAKGPEDDQGPVQGPVADHRCVEDGRGESDAIQAGVRADLAEAHAELERVRRNFAYAHPEEAESERGTSCSSAWGEHAVSGSDEEYV